VAGGAALYTDFTGLQRLKLQAQSDPAAARGEVARQFESIFLGQMLKSMRAASGGMGGITDSKQSLFYRDMHDQQLAVQLAKSRGTGLAEVIERQLGGQAPAARAGKQIGDYRSWPAWGGALIPGLATGGSGDRPVGGRASDHSEARAEFIRALRPHAERAGRALGVAPEALLAQAALETGWGQHVMTGAGGRSSHNLFGIKADRSWAGDHVQVSTVEYRDGVPLKTRAAFRSYGSFAESFADYVAFLRANPRYERALAVAHDPSAFVEELQRAGYATDPQYAAKLKRIMGGEGLGDSAAAVKPGGLRPI
jgi:flagellar protein FlgJ